MTTEVSWAEALRARLGAQVSDLEDARLEAVAQATLLGLRDWLQSQPSAASDPLRSMAPLGDWRPRGPGPRGHARWMLHLTPQPLPVPVSGPDPAAAEARQQAWVRACSQADQPLIDPDRRLMLVFSPKAACSTSVIWFFHQAGLAEEARAHHEWPHRYRIERYSAGERQARGRLLPPQDLRVVRVVRDPLDRAASSFRHALGTGYARDRILAATGVDTRTEALSFQRFIDFLETEDLDRCDPHHRRQHHPVEDLRAPDVVISTTEHDLFAGLNAAERRFGLPVTDFGSLAWVHDVQRHRVPRSVDMGERPDLVPLTTRQALSGPWPTGLLTPLARERLVRLYADDVARYTGLPDPAALG